MTFNSVALGTVVHMLTVALYPQLLKSWTNYAYTTRGQNTCYVLCDIILVSEH